MKSIRLILAASAVIATTLSAIYIIKPEWSKQLQQQLFPQTVPVMALTTLDGLPFDLKSWQGQVLVLNFWATWCPPCREEMPEFSQVYIDFRDKSVQFAGISIDSMDKVRAYQKARPVSYPLLLASHDALRQTAAIGNQSQSLPFTVIVDRNGHIAHTKLGKMRASELEQVLAELVKR